MRRAWAAQVAALGAALALAACAEDEPEPVPTPAPAALTACDPREASCVSTLAAALAAAHGIPWDPAIPVTVTPLPSTSRPRLPAPAWDAHLEEIPTLFDALEPAAPEPAGRALLLGRDGLVFQYDPRLDDDADGAARHRLGLFMGLGPELRARAAPGHPVDLGSPWPTLHLAREGLQRAIARRVEAAAQRADAGLDPWAPDPALLAAARVARRDRGARGGRGGRAARRLRRRPRALLVDRPAALADDCLPQLDGLDLPCVGVEQRDGIDAIEGFEPREAQAGDAILIEEALRAAGHRRRRTHMPSSCTSAHLAPARRRRGDAAGCLPADTPEAAEAFGGARRARDLVSRDHRVVTRVGGDATDPARFAERADRYVAVPLDAAGTVLSAGGEAGGECRVERPCDVRLDACRACLIGDVEALLGGLGPRPAIVELTPEEAALAYNGPLWAGDRLHARLDAAARFALGIERVRRSTTDEAAETQVAQVAAWYEGARRVVLIADPDAERDRVWENRVFVHELTHAWQSDRHGISARRALVAGPGDASEAYRVAVEGHGMLVEVLWHAALDGVAAEVDWRAAATLMTSDLAWRLGGEPEPALTLAPLLRYYGGYALHARAFADSGDLGGNGWLTEAWSSSAEVIARLRGERAPVAVAVERPTSADDALAAAGLTTLLRRELYAWPFALRIAPDGEGGDDGPAAKARGEAALDAVSGWTAGREAVFVTREGQTAVWVEGRWSDLGALERARALVEAHVEALAARTGGVARIERERLALRFAIAPDEETVRAVWWAVE
ncbi:MAG: hypothetical protein H6703_14285 [Myxococcales bacterium]|nr:hypothetical protein [Myxococcales bacterium]